MTGIFLVWVAMRGNFEAALSRVISRCNLLLHPGRVAEYCDQPVCLSVHEHIVGTAQSVGMSKN